MARLVLRIETYRTGSTQPRQASFSTGSASMRGAFSSPPCRRPSSLSQFHLRRVFSRASRCFSCPWGRLVCLARGALRIESVSSRVHSASAGFVQHRVRFDAGGRFLVRPGAARQAFRSFICVGSFRSPSLLSAARGGGPFVLRGAAFLVRGVPLVKNFCRLFFGEAFAGDRGPAPASTRRRRAACRGTWPHAAPAPRRGAWGAELGEGFAGLATALAAG